MYWSACLTLFLLSSCRGGTLRVPKVYNAIISSTENLTPSRAFPLIQPVIQETALGYPLSPVVYQEVKALQRSDDSEDEQLQNAPIFEVNHLPPLEQAKTETPKQDTNSKNQEQKNASKERRPLKLNQFGLPPSLLPISNYVPKVAYPYEFYNGYNPYFDPYNGLILPYNYQYNPYNPYYPFPYQNPFAPYPVIPPQFYNVPSTQPTGRQWPDQNWSSQKPETPDRPSTIKPEQPNYPPPDLNVKNNSNKNSDIPDVPPPPLPVGGLKYDKSKKSQTS